ncbi:MAG: hydroxyacid dehydrogenase [Chloroflexi bacterium]|nr:hydroxyacid dehydrogenase [Chloroflexota bacterium]
MSAPRVLVTVERPLLRRISTPEALARLGDMAESVAFNDDDRAWDAAAVRERIGGVTAVLASWGSCAYDEHLLDAAPELEIICYAAGTIRGVAPPAVFERGVRVAHAADFIAMGVAEHTLTVVLALLRRTGEFDAAMRAGRWRGIGPVVDRELYGKRYGIVGASKVGRRLIPLLRPFDVQIVVADPYLTESDAQRLGVHKLELPDLMRTSDVISIHAPVLPSTHHMIDAGMLALIKDDAVLVNNARSALVDTDALVAELAKERFDCALDVFDQEPLPTDHPLLGMRRVLLTPHVAGLTPERRSRLTDAMLDELERHLNGLPLRHEVTVKQLESMA